MTTHFILGAGSVGTALAEILVARGDDVLIGSRRGDAHVAGARSVSVDAASVASMRSVAPQAAVIYNCVNPRYHQWTRDWPPMSAAFMDYAEATGAVLAVCSNLYGYGPVEGPMTEDLPLVAPGKKARVRATMWHDAKARHDAGRIRMTEVRGSDYFWPTDQSMLGSPRVVPRVLAGKSVATLGHLDDPHTWTSPRDVAALLAVVGSDERAWGRPWHVPSNPPRTQREVVADLAQSAGVATPKLSSIPAAAIALVGLVNPLMREFGETNYQRTRPYILDDTAARETFGLAPTPWSTLVETVVAAYR